MKDNGEVEFKDLFNPKQPRANKETIEARMAVCKDCIFFKELGAKCTKCGCFMYLKTSLHNALCPIGKW